MPTRVKTVCSTSWGCVLGACALFVGEAIGGAGVGDPHAPAGGAVSIPEGLSGNDPMIVEDVYGAIERVRAAPEDGGAWNELASHYFTYSYWREAALAFERAGELRPPGAGQWYLLAYARYELGEVEGALDAAARARGLDPDHAPAWWRAGFWELERGHIDAAEALFRGATEVSPGSTPAWAGLARILLQRGDAAGAEALIRRRLLGGANDAYAHHLLAAALRRQGRAEEAEEAMGRSAAGLPRWPDPLIESHFARRTGYKAEKSRADALIRSGRYAESERIFESLLEHFPDDPELLNNLAVARFSKGDVEGGLRLWERAIEAAPADARAHLNLGRNLAQLAQRGRADHERALRHLDEAVRLNPAYADAWEARGTYLYSLGRLDAAEASIGIAESLGAGPMQVSRVRARLTVKRREAGSEGG